VIVARSTANCRLMLMPIDDNPAGRMASGNSREKLGHSGVAARHCTLYRRIAGYTVLKLAQLGPPDVRDLLEKRLHEVVTGTAGLYGASAKLTYRRDYPVTRNHVRQAEFAASVAAEVVGRERVEEDVAPVMGAEDFSFMLEARPGAFIFVGNGDSAGLHHPAYDFNDEVIPYGASYWVKLVETALQG